MVEDLSRAHPYVEVELQENKDGGCRIGSRVSKSLIDPIGYCVVRGQEFGSETNTGIFGSLWLGDVTG